MESIKVCPSTLAEGFDTYSPAARKLLFDGKIILRLRTTLLIRVCTYMNLAFLHSTRDCSARVCNLMTPTL